MDHRGGRAGTAAAHDREEIANVQEAKDRGAHGVQSQRRVLQLGQRARKG